MFKVTKITTLILALLPNLLVLTKITFLFGKNRMELFLSGSDPQIPYFMDNGLYIPTTVVVAVPATTTTLAIPERTIIKNVTQWTDEDKRLVNVDTKARSLLSMSMSDDVFDSV